MPDLHSQRNLGQEMLGKVRETLEALRPSIQRAWPHIKRPVLIGLSLYLMVVLLIWLPQRQLPASGLTLNERLQQENENRKTLAQILGGSFILVGIYLAWRRIRATEGQLRTMEGNLEIAREGQITERFTRAIEQFGSDKLEIRLGAIYALERIAKDSEKDHWTIMEVLSAYIRKHAPWKGEEELEDNSINREYPQETILSMLEKTEIRYLDWPIPSPDIQAILTVIGRRYRTYGKGEENRIDLRRTDLRGANLIGANLEGIHLTESHLERAEMKDVNLKKAFMPVSFLIQTDLTNADMSEAILTNTKMVNAPMEGVKLINADLRGADLEGANLSDSDLRGARLSRANLETTTLFGADLTGAVGLTEKQIALAGIDEKTKLPDYLKK